MLTEHFTEWKSKHLPNITFYEDGIINETEYAKQKTKILFIAKEPNGSNHKEENGQMSFCDEWNNHQPTYRFALRIGEWAAGILNDFPVFDQITEELKHDHLKKIAFMNVKKSKGVGITQDVRGFEELVKDQIAFIRRQIEIINPDIILLCLSHNKKLRDLLFPDATEHFTASGYGVDTARTPTKKIIDFYHPSSRNVPAAIYCLLKNVMQSFKE